MLRAIVDTLLTYLLCKVHIFHFLFNYDVCNMIYLFWCYFV